MQPDIKYLPWYYIRIALFMVMLFAPVFVFSQTPETGSVEYLKQCNGFNGIKLGSDINEIPIHQLAYMDGNGSMDADSCISYVYKSDNVLKADSDLEFQQVGLRVYKGRIVNIYLFFKIDDSYKILRDFLKDYGQFTDLPKEYANIYNWNTRAVNLSLQYQAKVETGVAVFTCNALVKQINIMKKRQQIIDDVIESFTSVAAYTNENRAAK